MKITIIASQANRGDGIDINTMDHFGKWHCPYLAPLIPVLQSAGYEVEVVAWNDPQVQWENKECILMGPAWDYDEDVKSFEALLKKLSTLNIPVLNHPKTMLWNLNKNYLSDLSKSGINVLQSIFVNPMDTVRDKVNEALKDIPGEFIAIKGVKDTGGQSFKKFPREDVNGMVDYVQTLQSKNDGAIIQFFMPEITNRGELSFVFFGDEKNNNNPSYMYIRIGPKDKERVQILHGGKSFHFTLSSFDEIKDQIALFKPGFNLSQDELTSAYEQAKTVRTKLNEIMKDKNLSPPTMFRLDGIVGNKSTTRDASPTFWVMETEMIEPYWEFEAAVRANPDHHPIHAYVQTIQAELNNFNVKSKSPFQAENLFANKNQTVINKTDSLPTPPSFDNH